MNSTRTLDFRNRVLFMIILPYPTSGFFSMEKLSKNHAKEVRG